MCFSLPTKATKKTKAPPSRSPPPTQPKKPDTNPHQQVIGAIDGSGRIRLVDSQAPADATPAVDLDLEKVLGSMPNKTFEFKTLKRRFEPLSLPPGYGPQEALGEVLRLPSVCSKRFLTTKVDRHVTGEFFVVVSGFVSSFFFRRRAPPSLPPRPPPFLFLPPAHPACDEETFPC